MTGRITPFLMFAGQAGDAIDAYLEVFPDGRVVSMTRYGAEGPGPEGTIYHAVIELLGQRIEMIDNPAEAPFALNAAFSFTVHLDDRAEVDRLVELLGQDGQTLMPLGEYPHNPYYAWLSDRFGVSWQIGLATSQD